MGEEFMNVIELMTYLYDVGLIFSNVVINFLWRFSRLDLMCRILSMRARVVGRKR